VITVYTDGACSGNPGPGGWAWAVAPEGTPRGSGGERSTTNQRMELQAVLEALRSLIAAAPVAPGPTAEDVPADLFAAADRASAPASSAASAVGPIEVVSDSTYVVNCFRDGWWVRWQANGWRNAKKQPVANADLWRPLVDLVAGHDVRFRWVKGHSGDPMNDLVDRLAVAAAPR
jgi:ribonuclease HI